MFSHFCLRFGVLSRNSLHIGGRKVVAKCVAKFQKSEPPRPSEKRSQQKTHFLKLRLWRSESPVLLCLSQAGRGPKTCVLGWLLFFFAGSGRFQICTGLCHLNRNPLGQTPLLRQLEKVVAVRQSLLEKFSGKFRHCWKIPHRFSGSTKKNPIPAKAWAFSGRENGCWKIGPAFGNAPGFSPLRPPQPS